MEEIAAFQTWGFEFDLPTGSTLALAEPGYAKRVDAEPSGFKEVVEDIVFLW